jgi:hypothetical protein
VAPTIPLTARREGVPIGTASCLVAIRTGEGDLNDTERLADAAKLRIRLRHVDWIGGGSGALKAAETRVEGCPPQVSHTDARKRAVPSVTVKRGGAGYEVLPVGREPSGEGRA